MLKKIASLTLLIATITTSFLFSPPPRKEQQDLCAYIALNRYMGVIANTDSYAFCQLAENPNDIWTNTLRQSRPLYPFLGAILGSCFNLLPMQKIVGDKKIQTHHEVNTKRGDKDIMTSFIPYYAGYVFLNYLILLITLLLYHRLLIYYQIDKVWIWLSSVLLLSNEVTKAFFWTPHQQMCNILLPILAMYLTHSVISGRLSNRQIMGINIILGVCSLMYMSFWLAGIAVLAAWLLYDIQSKKKLSTSHFIFPVVNVILLFLPFFIWIFIVKMKVGQFAAAEVKQYNYVFWLFQENVWELLQTNTIDFFLTLKKVIFLPTLIIFLLLGFHIWNEKQSRIFIKTNNKIVFFASFAFFFCFLWVLGGYLTRLTFTLFPFLLLMIAYLIQRIVKRYEVRRIYWVVGLSVVVICCHLYWVSSYGPFY